MFKIEDEKQKKEIFYFKKIKPSLVFFNRDGGSLSIISNNDKYDKEYQDLHQLWNSQNVDISEMKDLVDYKNLTHEQFLEEIIKLFSLDTSDGSDKQMGIKDLEKICEDLDNYIFVADNYIKMVRILLNIEAKIPLIIMGETGVGKTKLLEMLSILYGRGKQKWHRLQIHAGTTDKDIVEFIENVLEKEKNGKNELIWVFLDEINTCNSLGLITEIICNHTYLGKKIDERFIFLAACNPYRIMTNKMRENGLVYYNMKEKNKLNNLVYTVNPLPHSLLNFIFDFGSLKFEDEKKYIINTIVSLLEKIISTYKIDISNNELNYLKNEIIDSIIICHEYLRSIFDQSSVSMREIRRFGIFFEYFIKFYKSSGYNKMKSSLNMSLYLCYYLRLNEKKYREELEKKLDKFYVKSFLVIPEAFMRSLTGKMLIEKNKGIALNRALKENLFSCFSCIENNIPIIIVGKPGTGKSLSFQILFNTLKGESSENSFFRSRGKLYRYYYQGSETSTSDGILQVFQKALNAKKKSSNDKNIILVFFDEMGLAERSSNNPLKVIHFLLETNKEDSVPFLGISNWRLDASKINRAINLSITDYDIKDLEETGNSIAEALDTNLANNYKDFFETLARVYYEYIKQNQNSIKGNKDFHGNRDFYNLIKNAMSELKAKEEQLKRNENKILTEVGLLSLSRNFGGLENSIKTICDIFRTLYAHKYDESVSIKEGFTVLDAIRKNVNDPNSRYLMLISEGNDATDITKYLLGELNKKYIELVGSKYQNDIKSGRYNEEILNKIKYIMETDNVLILRDLDMIYPSLYDIFNQNFTIMGDKMYGRIAFEYAKISSEVNKDFHVIVIVNINQIENLKLDPPFLNRFEKHIVNFNMFLEEKDINIAKKIIKYIDLIASFNNNKELKIDLEKLLINCKQHHIEGLIFKIKNDYLSLINNDNKEKKENWIEKEGQDYENNMIEEVLKKIVPTFCQDIMVAIVFLEKNLKKYDKISKNILNIYNKNNYNNFEAFFKKIKSRKNIIYTFSKVTENLLDDNKKEIENKFGKFSIQSFNSEMIESIKAENELIFILNTFANSKDKKILVLHFTENDLNKINSINYLIDNFQKGINNLSDKFIIFLIHKQRNPKLKKKVIPDMIPFIDDNFFQIFIDNLQGKENVDILQIIQKKNEELAKEYLENSNYIEKKIYTVLNYIKFNILNENINLNMKNYMNEIYEKIINNEYVKTLLIKNLKKQGKELKNIIKDIFTNDIIEVNDVDFFEVISSKLGNYFFKYLLKIVYFGLKDCVLCPLLYNTNLELITGEPYIKNMIEEYFEKTEFNGPMPRMSVNANNITIYNGLEIPRSKFYLEPLIKYVNEAICSKYLKNENSLRSALSINKIDIMTKQYNRNLERFEENIKIEINKQELLNVIFNKQNNELRKILLEDYLVMIVIKYIEKKEIKYELNSRILNFLKLIIKIKLSESNNHIYDFTYSQKEFIEIIIFTLGYKEDIKTLLDIFVEFQKYCNNIEELMQQVLANNKIRFEISERSQGYTRIVNVHFFFVLESLIRAVLLFSKELIKDEFKFFDFFYSLKSIEASLEKINKKFYLYSKEIYGMRYMIKIEEALQSHHDKFFSNYEKILEILLQQSNLYYYENFAHLFAKIEELLNLLDELFVEKNEEYIHLLLYIYSSQYRNIFVDEIRIKLLEKFFENKLLLNDSKIFLTEMLKIIKPEVYDEKKGKEETFINNFLNFENKKYEKLENLIKILNNINSEEFNELLLFLFELQCQSYFQIILDGFENEYSKNCCEKLLLGVSLEYLKKSIQYSYENKNNNKNNLLKLYSIAYIKTYCYYYVEINYKHFDNIIWDEINKILDDKDEENKIIRNMRNIYIWRLYCKKFENFEQFKNFDLKSKNISIYEDLQKKLQEEKDKPKYTFKNSFINPYVIAEYKKLAIDYDKGIKIDFNEYNNKFDLFYSCMVNKTLSFIYGNDKEDIINKMKEIYDKSKDLLKFNDEGKKLYEYLLNYELFKEKIETKISEKELSQNDFEFLLYSFRFIFNTQINESQCFYNEILKPKLNDFINNNYIPGAYPKQSLYSKAYFDIQACLEKCRLGRGYYVCKDCGYFYIVPYCTFPIEIITCPNNHKIGGENHICYKKDIRVFASKADIDTFVNNGNMNYINSFVMVTLDEFKVNYVDKYEEKLQKGIYKTHKREFEKNEPIRKINIISFRVLNFILNSYLMGNYILGNITDEEAEVYLIKEISPKNFFGLVKNNWILLKSLLNELKIENVQIFLNMIFNGLIDIISNLKEVNTEEKLLLFEKQVDEYIMGKIAQENNAEKLNKEYQEANSELLKCDPYSLKEIILENYDPSIYNQKIYPDIQYYTVSHIQNFNNFANKFNSLEENKNKYFLINTLINKNEGLTQNLISLRNLPSINELTNLLIALYSYKISREDAKRILMKDKLEEIKKSYEEINSIKINSNEKFIEKLITPFIKSWNNIKESCTQYRCIVLRDLEKGEKPLDMSIDLPLSFFLVDDGDKNGGMFLASAYEKMIEWQNNFIDIVINNNKLSGIHNSYVSQLEQEIDIQEASKDEIINIDKKLYKSFNNLINTTAMRNIFSKNGKDNIIQYKNYNDLEYNYEFIEEELGKLIFPGVKKFKKDKIKFITYLYEGFRAGNSSVLVDYNMKYPQRKLNEEEEKKIEELCYANRSNKFNNEIFSNLQIIMNDILKENYEPNFLIIKIINNLSEYITLNEELIKMFKNTNDYFLDEPLFSIDCLVTIFEYFERLCWEDINKYLDKDYQLVISEETKKYINDYFEKNKDNKDKIINTKNFTSALRKLISRYLTGSRQEIDIKSDAQLILYIKREDLWPKEMMEGNNEDKFTNEIFMICKGDITIGNCFDLYNFLEGDNFLKEEIEKNKGKEMNIKKNRRNDNGIEENEENNKFEDDDEEGEDNYRLDDDEDNGEKIEC